MKVFHPLQGLTEYVDATCGADAHPKGTQYRVAIGTEIWEEQNPLVLKVQMVYEDFGVQGRRSPSFPLHSNDFERVQEAVKRLRTKARKIGMVVG